MFNHSFSYDVKLADGSLSYDYFDSEIFYAPGALVVLGNGEQVTILGLHTFWFSEAPDTGCSNIFYLVYCRNREYFNQVLRTAHVYKLYDFVACLMDYAHQMHFDAYDGCDLL